MLTTTPNIGGGATASTGLSDSANLARLNVANTFTAANSITAIQVNTPTIQSSATPAFGETVTINGTTFSAQQIALRANSYETASALNQFNGSGVRLGRGSGKVLFAPGAGYNTEDAGIDSPNAGVVEINNGTTGTYRDLLCRAVTMNTAGLLSIKSGTNQRAGNTTLVSGTKTVANTTVTANTVVMLTRKTSGGTIGTSITYTIAAGTGFTITSDNVLDTSTFSYLLIEVP